MKNIIYLQSIFYRCTKKFIPLLYVVCLLHTTLAAKTLIITHQCDRPQFIELHYKTFKKFLINEDGQPDENYEYIVFNDAPDVAKSDLIEDICARNAIKCIRVPQEIHNLAFSELPPEYNPKTNFSIRHAMAIQYSFDKICLDHNGIVVMVDCDMLLIRPFSIVKHMRDCDISSAFRRMSNVDFFWPGLVFFNMPIVPERNLLSFNPTFINDQVADTGAATYYFLQKHPELRIKAIYMLLGDQLFCSHDHDRKSSFTITLHKEINTGLSSHQQELFLREAGFSPQEIYFLQKKPINVEFFLDNHFMHFRGIPIWTGISTQDPEFLNQINLCQEFITDILAN